MRGGSTDGVAGRIPESVADPAKAREGVSGDGRIFNKRIHSLAIPFLSSDLHIPAKERREVGTPQLGGVNTETAFNEATVRLIREKNK